MPKVYSDNDLAGMETATSVSPKVYSDEELGKMDEEARYGFPDDTPESDTFDSAIRGGLDALTLKHMDEISGGMKHPIGAWKAFTGVSEKQDPDVAAYREEQKNTENIYKRAQQEHPWAFFGGGVGGTIAGPGKLLKSGKLLPAAALGAGMGAGGSEGKLSEKQYGKIGLDSAVGAGVGLGSQVLSNKIGSAISKRISPALSEGADSDIAQETAKKGKSLAEELLGKAKPIENPEEIASAVKDISGQNKVPNYLLTNDRNVKRMADTLLNQPTIGGNLTRQEMQPIYDGIEQFGKEVAEQAGTASPYQTGTQVAKGAADKFKELIAPAEAVYGELESKFQQVPLEKLAFKRAIGKLRNKYSSDFTGSSQRLIDNIEKTFMGTTNPDTGKVVGGVQDVAQLRKLRTNLGQYLNGNASGAERNIIGEMYSVLTRERDRSILKNAISSGSVIGRDARAMQLLRNLKGADKVYREGVSSVSDALGVQGSSRQATSSAIRDYLKDTPPEQLVKDLFDKGDVNQLRKIEQVFPEQFELLRKRAIADLVEKSSSNGSLETSRMVRNLSKYGPEVQQMLLGGLFPKAKSAQTVLGALPKDYNPSHTAHAMSWKNVFHPSWYAENAYSIPQRAALVKGSPGLDQLTQATKQAPDRWTQIIDTVKSHPAGQKFVAPLMKAAQRGNQSLAATQYLLSQKYPEFRQLMDQEEGHGQ